MKKYHLAAAASFSLVLAMPALAGPNWQIIHAAEHDTHEQMANRIVLPLDHGPRALSTPWINKQEELEMLARKQKTQSVKVAAHAARQSKIREQ